MIGRTRRGFGCCTRIVRRVQCLKLAVIGRRADVVFQLFFAAVFVVTLCHAPVFYNATSKHEMSSVAESTAFQCSAC